MWAAVDTRPEPTPPPLPGLNYASPTLLPPGPDRRPPMLSWPALLPTLAYVVVQAMYGWPAAKLKASSPEYATSYFIGGLIGGVALALIVTAVVYAISRRRKGVGTTVYSCVLLLLCASVLTRQSQAPKPAGTTGATSAAAAGPQSYPLAGVALAGPDGWTSLSPDRPDIIARWVTAAARPDRVGPMVIAQALKPKSPDLATTARDLAAKWGGRVADEPEQLAGVPALRVTVDNPSPGAAASSATPSLVLVAIRDERLYLLSAGGASAETCRPAFDAVRQSWRWVPVESPTQHLEFRAQPFTAFGGSVSLAVPAAMFPYPTQDVSRTQGLTVVGLAKGGPEFDAHLQVTDLPEDDLGPAKERLATGTAQSYKTEPFAWRAVDGPTERAMTDPVRAQTPDGASWIAWAIVRLDGRRVVLSNFSTYVDDPEARSAYARAAERMVASMARVAGKPLPGTP